MSPSRARPTPSKPKLITRKFLSGWPLPPADEAEGKDGRGRVLVVAGNRGLAGAAVLCATAALRAGAGKLRIAAPESLVEILSALVPEAYVLGLREGRAGVLDPRAATQIEGQLERVDALVVGPGMESGPSGQRAVTAIVGRILPRLGDKTLVLDAVAMDALRKKAPEGARVIVTPHLGEMAHLTGRAKDKIAAGPVPVARDFAARTGATVVLKGRETVIATPRGELFRNTRGNAGLGTSGSGDVLSGIVVGLAARGAAPERAAAWGVFAHAVAGEILAREVGAVGYLARELGAKVPRALGFDL